MKFKREILPGLTFEFEADCPDCVAMQKKLQEAIVLVDEIRSMGIAWTQAHINNAPEALDYIHPKGEKFILAYYKKYAGKAIVDDICSSIRKGLNVLDIKKGDT